MRMNRTMIAVAISLLLCARQEATAQDRPTAPSLSAPGEIFTPTIDGPPVVESVTERGDAPLRPAVPGGIIRMSYTTEEQTETADDGSPDPATTTPSEEDDPIDVEADEPEAFKPEAIDPEGLRQRVAASALPDDEKEILQTQVGAIGSLLSSISSEAKKAASFDQQTRQLEAKLKELPEQIAELEQRPIATVPAGLSQLELDQRLAAAEREQQAADKVLSEVNETIATRKSSIAPAEQQLAELAKQQAGLPKEVSDEVSGLAAELERIKMRAKAALIGGQIAATEARIQYLNAVEGTDLGKLERQLAAIQLDAASTRVNVVRRAIEQLKQAEVDRAARVARDAVAEATASLKGEAEKNTEIIDAWRKLNSRAKELSAEKERVKELLREFTELKAEHQPALEAEEMTEFQGLQLRVALDRLPELGALNAQRTENISTIREINRRRFEIESALQELESIEAAATQIIEDSEGEYEPYRAELIALLKDRKAYLEKLSELAEAIEKSLAEIERDDKVLVETVSEFRDDAEASVLWVRSNPPLFASDWTLSPQARALLRPETYVRQASLVMGDVRREPVMYVLAAAALFVLLLVRSRVWKNCRPAIDAAQKRNNTRLRPYVRVLIATIALAAFWPIVLGFVGFRIVEADPTAIELGSGVLKLSVLFFTMEFIRHSCRKEGLGELLGLPRSVTAYVRRKVLWLEWAALPLSASILVLHETGVGRGPQLGERVCFAASMFVLAAFFHKMLRTTSPLVSWSRNDGGMLGRYRLAFHLAAVGLPLFLAIISILGYHFAGLRLAAKLQQTLWIGLGVLVARLLLVQFVQLHRRRMAIAAIQERAARRDEEPQAGAAPQPDATPAADIGEMSQQLRRLIGTLLTVLFLAGLYLTWVDVLPSLERVANFEIYSVERVSESGDRDLRSIGPIDLALAFVVGVIAFTASRNLPGLLEFTVLDRVGLDRSVRYAITTICSYVIAIIGLMFAGKAAGFAWQNVQWLAAGLTVGLGFGLQEIFANFVSGLIIFIEQPVRVGDIVTLGDVTGSVTRIRIRATTITNWDRKEYIVPNREFITGRLLNWTLSDQTNRVVVEVGVAYGSDVALVRSLILAAASEHPEVMDDPSPIVTFEAFGDSSLHFVLRCFLPTLENRLGTIHELHERINNRFQEAGIEIPFPQRDLHVRSIPSDDLSKLADESIAKVA